MNKLIKFSLVSLMVLSPLTALKSVPVVFGNGRCWSKFNSHGELPQSIKPLQVITDGLTNSAVIQKTETVEVTPAKTVEKSKLYWFGHKLAGLYDQAVGAINIARTEQAPELYNFVANKTIDTYKRGSTKLYWLGQNALGFRDWACGATQIGLANATEKTRAYYAQVAGYGKQVSEKINTNMKKCRTH